MNCWILRSGLSPRRLSCDESSAPGGWAHGVGCAGRRGRSPDLWLECGVVPSDLASDDRQKAGGSRQRVDGNGHVPQVLRENRVVGAGDGAAQALSGFREMRGGGAAVGRDWKRV